MSPHAPTHEGSRHEPEVSAQFREGSYPQHAWRQRRVGRRERQTRRRAAGDEMSCVRSGTFPPLTQYPYPYPYPYPYLHTSKPTQSNTTPPTQLLTASDLAPNPVLVRKIKRLLAAQQNTQIEDFSDDNDDDDDNGPKNPSSFFGGGSSRKPEEIGSSPTATRTPRLKNERRSVVPGFRGGGRGGSRQVSMVPNSQVGGSQIVDLEGED